MIVQSDDQLGAFMLAQISLADEIHGRAIEISIRYKRAEADLVDVIQQVEDHRVFLKRGHASLFSYVVGELGISESMAYSLITVARKARQVPELKARLQSGEMTLSNARRVATVLTPQNQDEWIAKATELSGRQLEKEIVKLRPQEATPERASYVSSGRVKLEVGLSEEEMLRLRRVQDLESQAQRKAVSLEEVIAALNSEYLRRHDPVEKAKRHRVRRASPAGDAATAASASAPKPAHTPTSGTTDASASTNQNKQTDQKNQTEPVKTHVALREVESQKRIPVSQGGLNTADNLITLCSAHHQLAHL